MASPDKRYQVFVSSTYADLLEERQGVTAALLQLNAFPSGMEIFPAADDDAWTLIERVIDECDYYLLVIAGKYGSINEQSGVSYTEREYDYAVSKGKPVMAFVHADPTALPAAKYETDPAKREKLDAFRSKVQKAKHVKFWRSAEDLAGKVALSYSQFTQQYPSVGWVRADGLASTEALGELVTLRKRVLDLEAELRNVRVSAPPESQNLASGDEEFEFEAYVRGHVSQPGGYSSTAVTHWFDGAVAWDKIFHALAPKLLSESSEKDLKDALKRFITSACWDKDIQDGLIEEARTVNPDVEFDDIRNKSIEITDETFGTVLVQLLALGLIQKGVQKRGVNDHNKYWTVTPWGEKRALRLRAIPSSAGAKSKEL